jgi:hypothetical protein
LRSQLLDDTELLACRDGSFPLSNTLSVMATQERPFLNITTAPQDGRVIEVRHGRKQEIVLAE